MKQPKGESDLAARGGFYRVLIENTVDMLFVLSADGLILYASPSVKEGMDFLPEELMGMHSTDLVHPEDQAAWEEALEKVRQRLGDVSVTLDVRVRQRNGGWRYVERIVRVLDESFGVPTFVVCSRDITERRQMQISLSESESKFRMMAESAPVGIYIIQEGLIRYANPRFAEISGFPLENVVGKKIDELVLLEDRHLITEIRRRLDAEGLKQVDVDFRGVNADGQILDLEVYGSRINYNDKPAMIGMLLDITERERLKKNLQKSEEQYRTLVETLQEAVYKLSLPDLKFTYANSAALKISGYSQEEIMAMRVSDCLTAEEYAHVKAFVTESIKAAETDPSYTIPFDTVQMICKDGSRRWIEYTSKLVRGDDGTIVAMQNVARDITERRAAEEALRESEERYRILTENMTDVVWVIDVRTFKHLYVSPSVERYSDYTREEYIKLRPNEILTPETAEKGARYFRRSLEQAAAGLPVECPVFEAQAMRKDGSSVWSEISYNLVYDKEGRVVAIQGSNRDITARKAAEEALQASEEQYRLLTENMTDIVWLLDPSTFKYRYISPSIERISGYSREEFIKLLAEDVMSPESAEKSRQCFRQVLGQSSAGLPVECAPFEVQIIRKDGSTVWGEVSYNLVYDKEGRVVAIQGANRDITARKTAEDSLRESEERYRELIDTMNDAVVQVDPVTFRYLYVNEATLKLSGYSREEMLSMTLYDLSSPDERSKVRDYVDRFIDSEAADPSCVPPPLIRQVIVKNKISLWLESVIKLKRDDAGLVKYIQFVSRDITDRKQALDAMRQSEEKYRLLAENVNDMINVVDLHTRRYIYSNPAAERILGYTPEELSTMTSEQVIVPEDRAEIRDYMLRVVGDPSLKPFFEVRLIRKDGARIWAEVNYKYLYDKAGKRVAIQTVARDITERKATEEALRKSEERYRLLTENMTDVVWLIDARTFKHIYVSPSIERMTGYKREEYINQRPKDVVLSPESAERGTQYIMRSLKQAAAGLPVECPTYEVQAFRKDGSSVWAEITYNLVYDESGQVVAIQGTNRDITERKATEEALRKSEERYRLLTENMSDVVWLIDAKTFRHLYVSPSIEKISGYTRKEYMEIQPRDVMSPASAEKAAHNFMRSLEQAAAGLPIECPTYEVQAFRKDGSSVWAEISYNLVYDDSGRVVAIQGANRDITERKAAEEALRESERRYRHLADNMSDFVTVLDVRTGKYLYVSPSIEKHTQYSVEEVLSLDFRDLLPPASQKVAEDRIARAIRTALEGEKAEMEASTEIEVIRKDGSHMWIDTAGSPVYDEAGNFIAIQLVSRDITARKETEEALRVSEQRYRHLVDNMSDFVTVMDIRTGKYLYASPSVETHTQYTVEEVLALDFRTTLTPESLAISEERIAEAIRSAAERGKAELETVTEIEVIRKDGSHVWFEAAGKAIYDNDGNITAVQLVNRDITPRKNLEVALRENERRFRAMAENMSDYFVVFDARAGKYEYVSPSAEHYTQYTVKELMSMEDPFIRMTPESRAREREAFQWAKDAAVPGVPLMFLPKNEYEIIRKDGVHVWFETSSSATYDEAGNLLSVQSVNRDITERKRLEEALREGEKRFRHLAENMNDYVSVFDVRTMTHTYFSPSAERHLLYTVDELLQMAPRQLLTPASWDRASQVLYQAMKGNAIEGPFEMDKIELEVVRKDGSHIWIEASSTLTYDETGQLATIQYVSRNVSERKKVQDALVESEKRFRYLAENMSDFFWLMDPYALKFLYISPVVEKYMQYTSQELIDMKPEAFFTPESLQRIREILNAVIKSAAAGIAPEIKPFELEAIRRDGSHVWFEVNFSLNYDEEGNIVTTQGVNRDITDRKRVEAVLRQSEEKYRELAEYMSEAVAQVDATTMLYSYVNPALCRLIGYSAEELTRMHPWDVSNPEDYEKMKEAFVPYRESGRNPDPAQFFETRVFHKNGSEIWLEYTWSLIRDESGQVKTIQTVNRDITERKRIQVALRQKEEQYRQLAESMTDAVAQIDINTMKFNYVNPALCSLAGYSAEELMQMHSRDVIPQEDYARLREAMAPYREAGRSPEPQQILETRILHKDGSEIWLEYTWSLILDESGQVKAIQTVNRDITVRKRIQEALRQKEEQFRQLAESMTEAVVQLGLPELRPVYVNPAMIRLTGYSSEEILRFTEPWRFVAPEHRSLVQQYLVRHIEAALAGEDFSLPPLEVCVPKKDGTTIWVGLTCSVIRDVSGKPITIQTVNRDITERKRVEEALQKREEQYRQLAEQTNDMIVTIDYATQKVIYFNPAALRILGYSADELYGQDLDQLMTPDSLTLAQERFRRVLENRESPGPLELQVICRDGSLIWIESMISFTFNEDGTPVSVQGFHRDITERKMAEEELAKRTADLIRSNADLEQFAYIASHDLQEPLRMVASFTELLAKRYRGKLGSDADEFIAYAVDGANRMKQLINDLLDYSRVGTRGKAMKDVDCNNVFQQVLSNLSMAVKDSAGTVRGTDLPVVRGDAGQLLQLFQNLIGNALKFHGSMPPVIEITAQERTGDWLFAFKDNGIGIRREDCERIFAVFQRTHKSKAYPGTGIGLAICRKIVERHGGRIWVESELDQGSTFYFTIPR